MINAKRDGERRKYGRYFGKEDGWKQRRRGWRDTEGENDENCSRDAEGIMVGKDAREDGGEEKKDGETRKKEDMEEGMVKRKGRKRRVV